jgi:hypothetical protein
MLAGRYANNDTRKPNVNQRPSQPLKQAQEGHFMCQFSLCLLFYGLYRFPFTDASPTLLPFHPNDPYYPLQWPLQATQEATEVRTR